ncbi:hypothetical protein NV379_06925 [Paenibacillus sp. N1-5-1-14]|uniref:hypothetical protein n=1 Tax=Paenibacillus radicibacter TaxID=2972488 RepID=UPI00215913E4|nr:hypothetical protein [Paenibacillus radicibacter]MCR8642392.1 hypothetical protein [Paenibacillus radicibacter]
MINIFRQLSNKDIDERDIRLFTRKIKQTIQSGNEQYRKENGCMHPVTKPKWK